MQGLARKAAAFVQLVKPSVHLAKTEFLGEGLNNARRRTGDGQKIITALSQIPDQIARITINTVLMKRHHLPRHFQKILKRAVEKEELTLKNSIGVGDTEADIAFLKLVERPIAFNPNLKLYKYAKKAGWTIVTERKDVIYKIK